MVSHNLEFGYIGYKLPPKARARRSVRKSRVFEKKIPEDDKMCGFNLLATLAGNLLLESGNSLCSSYEPVNVGEDKCVAVQNTVKKEFQIDEKPLNSVPFCKDNPCKELPIPFDFQCGVSSVVRDGEKVESSLGGSDSCQIRNCSQETELGVDGDAVVLNAKADVVVNVSSKSSTELPVCGNDAPSGSWDGVNLVSRDDDENFSGYIRPCMTKTLTRPVSRSGDRRMRKLLASRHWTRGSRNADAKPWYISKRDYYLHHQRNYPIKKRKYFGHNFDLISDCRLHKKAHKGSRTISSMKSRNASFVSRDHHVRLRIKSFRVPELYIEIPEAATVGSLKRMVLEAVTTKLSDGLQVGMMIQGKKVRDDSKTLLQSGISKENTHIQSLGFSLEPSTETTAQTFPSCLPENAVSHLQTCDDLSVNRTAKMGNPLDSDHHSTPYPPNSFGKICTADDSRALVPASEADAAVESSPRALTVLFPQPPSHKSKTTEQQQQLQAAHRRIRRPFSVSEVEALVLAVEQLGTGRWRDVKLHAFENTDHRTYVDLKDKWKTLVHTARIPPQQRRGEPVPQDLLDRVLKAHAYWSQQHLNMEQVETPTCQAEALMLPL